MKKCVNRVCVGLGAIAGALIPFTPASYAQTANIDGYYLSGVANICSSNVGGTFSPDVWNCMAGAVSMTLSSQTRRPQPRLTGAYLRRVGDECSVDTQGSFTPAVWDCMAQAVVNDMPFRRGVRAQPLLPQRIP